MNRQELEQAHQQALKHYEDFISTQQLKESDHEKVKQAKTKWETAWNELMQTLLVLERIEI